MAGLSMDGTNWIDKRADRMTEVFARTPLAVDFPFLKGVSIPSVTLHSLQDAALNFLQSSVVAFIPGKSMDCLPRGLKENRHDLEALPNKTPNGVIRPYLENVKAFKQFSDVLYSFLANDKLSEGLSHLQVPPNLRLVTGTNPGAHGKRPYATDKLHTDVWAGEPQFSLNILIPILGDIEAVNVRFCQPSAVPPDLRRPLTDYSAAKPDALGLTEYDLSLRCGIAYFFDTFLFHQTIRRGEGLRLSADLRGLFKVQVMGEESPWEYPSRFMTLGQVAAGVSAECLAGSSIADTPYHR